MHPNEALARREIAALASGDEATLRDLYADGFVLHYPGNNPLAGDHPNFESFMAKVWQLFGDGATVTPVLHDALGNDQHAIQLVTVTANAKGKTHTWHSVAVLHTSGGKISEAWIHFQDQHAVDAFLNSLV
jgi:ketosteroid isomerase-like protein